MVQCHGGPPKVEIPRRTQVFGMPDGAPRPVLQPWARTYPAVRAVPQQSHDESGLADILPQVMSMPSDQVAMQQVDELRNQLRELNAKYDADKRAADEKFERERDKTVALEKKALEEERKHEKEMLELRIDMQSRMQPQKSPLDIVSLLAGLAPVAIALIESGKSRQQLNLQMQQESTKQQIESVKMLVADKGKGGSELVDTLKVVIPALAPFVTTFMSDRSPSAVAKLTSAMADGQLQTISMVSQLMQQLAENNDSPWMDVARQAIAGIQNVAKEMVEVNMRKSQPVAPRVGAGAPAPVPLTADTPAADIADAIVAAQGVPQEYKTQEWREVFRLVHDAGVAPREAAVALSQLLDKLGDEDKLPQAFAGVLDNSGPQPSTLLRPMLEQLPIGQFNPARVQAICAEFDKVLGDE